jgi:hypothetical protein
MRDTSLSKELAVREALRTPPPQERGTLIKDHDKSRLLGGFFVVQIETRTKSSG